MPVNVKEESSVTMTVEIRSQKMEDPTITVESKFCKKLEERLRREFESYGDDIGSFEEWKEKVLKDGTLYNSLGIDGEDEINVKNEVRKICSEKIMINFPLDARFFMNFMYFSKVIL